MATIRSAPAKPPAIWGMSGKVYHKRPDTVGEFAERPGTAYFCGKSGWSHNPESGGATDRQGLGDAFSHLRTGDTLCVWRLDRLGRSLKHLIETITALNAQGIGFASITERIDTTTSGGKLVFHIFGALAEFERDIVRERTQAGLEAARSRGKRGGRRKTLSLKDIAMVKKLYADQTTTVNDICKTFNISRMTLWRYVKGK